MPIMTESEFNALPLPQRKGIQHRLIDLGLYAGEADGKFGNGTKTALKAEEDRRVADEERARQGRIAEESAAADTEIKRAQAEKVRAEAEKDRTANERKKAYVEESNAGYGRAASIGANAVALPAGFTAGRIGGKGINALANISQNSKNTSLQGIAGDRLSGLTTREGARTGARLSGAMPSDNALLRVGGRALPHIIGGVGAAAKGASMLANSFQGDDFYTDMTNRAMGLGLIGSGVGLVQEGGRYAVNPDVTPDGRSIAIIESNQLRRNGLPGAVDRGQVVDAEVVPEPAKALPAPQAAAEPAPGSKAYYVQEAKRLGVKGATRKTKADLVEAVNAANAGNAGKRVRAKKIIPGLAGPAIAAGLAYAATPSDANASNGADSYTGQDEALTNAAAAGGITYGANKLLRLAPALAGQAISTGMAMTAPFAAADAYDPTPEQLAMDRNITARYLPRPLQFGAVSDAYDMAQVPEKGPAHSGPRADDFDSQLAQLNAILAELGQGQEAPAQAPMPMAPNSNRLLMAGR